jgi:lipopolysaccharide biosynthesis glycosyltransferase
MGDCELHLHEVNPRALEHLVLTHDRFTAEVYHRLLIPEVLDVARVLYLDCDTVVLGRLDELFEIDLGDTPVAAVRDAVVRRNAVLGMSPEAPYLNSGVLVMDLERWRSEGLAEQVMDFICSNPDAIRFVDQCGINAVLDGRWMPLDADYNRQVGVLTPRTFGGPCREHPNTRIVHFAGDQKPWLLAERPPWRRAYWRHRNATPFRAMLPDGIRPHSIARLGWRTLVGGVRAVKRWRAG